MRIYNLLQTFSNPVTIILANVGKIRGQILTDSELQTTRQGIGTRLKEARIALGLTQAELGNLAGFNQTVVQYVEDGVLRNPYVTSSLASALELTPAWIQWGESFMKKKVRF